VITEVKVSIESAETGLRFSTVSNGVGAYLLPAVPVGTYTLSFGKAGFQTKKYDKLALTVGQTRTLNVTLDIGATSTQIDVAGEADALVFCAPDCRKGPQSETTICSGRRPSSIWCLAGSPEGRDHSS
jgi:hypothetical protein